MRLVVDGLSINAATGAVPVERDSTDPLVVLLHGAGMDRSVWSQQTRFLAHHGYRALAVDLPGHGDSEGPALKSVSDLATWVASLAAELGGPLHLVGHSMGSLMALEAAARQPASVASIVLLGVAATMPVHPDLQAAADADDVQAARLITSWAHGSKQHTGENPTPGLWMLGGTQALLERCAPGVLASDLSACSSYVGSLEAAALASCPVTLILGSADKMAPRKGAGPLIEAFSHGASVVELAGTGHMMMQEEPGAVRRAIIDHLENSNHS
ncbi:MAG: alpha/beta hydrolase [Acidimicrobiales bacterium]|nr:alpha/beta hydrolase [Acidimicrobiales bacterium]HJO79730.1 alpha/beta hydrolase [Acidimicrobiales bacterium]